MSKSVAKASPAPKGKAAIAKAVDRIWEIPLAKIDLDGKNHRMIRPGDEARILELVDSFKTLGADGKPQGQRTAGIVYEVAGKNYLLGVGHRRYEASNRLGITFKAIIKPMPARSEIEAERLIENITQQHLTPVEQTVGVNQLVDALGGEKDLEAAILAVSKRVGQTVQWVRDRLYFNRLTKKVQGYILAGRLALAHAKELSKIGGEEQERMAEYCCILNEDGSGSICGIPTLRSRIAVTFRSLKVIPWRLEHSFKGVEGVMGACKGCTYNSGTDSNLFAKDAPADPVCLKADCYARKSAVCEEQRQRLGAKMAAKGLKGEKEAEQATASSAPYLKPASVARVASKIQSADAPPKADATPKETEEQKFQRLSREGQNKFWHATSEYAEAAFQTLVKTAAKTPGAMLGMKLVIGAIGSNATPDRIAKGAPEIGLFFAKGAWGKDITKLEKILGLPRGIDSHGNIEGRIALYGVLAKVLKAKIGVAPVLATFLPKKPEQKMAEKLKIKK